MNLGKLLGVGKCFFGSDPLAAYRLNKRAYLPKFNDGKNPFAPKTEAAPSAPAPVTENKAAPAAARPPKATPPYAFKPAAKLVAKHAKPAEKPVRPGWTTRLNPFRAPEPVAQLPLGVQEELSLDAVKVVHNDLADADVEIVPVSSRAVAPTPAVLPPARQAWEYLGENLLKSS